ncbi:GFA family protein [Roseomonas marmotae]|uniref:GFA family protein n=1 Tax=Roseomonas marmotae TaxID=2768161 RepID=A0ABS3K9D7_9PROT|nr:GFA family protein [Roseomonas marmotae]MBO1074074.1 GFA family protein [Roseomonas marmotae]QTI78859.1 GFA family protein [Roseomonas marmotae]
MTLKGGCYCGEIRYEGEGAPFHSTICHCQDCRRVAGAPFVAWFSLPVTGLRFTAGEPARFASSDKGRRSFCPRCGTPLTFQSTDLPDEVDIATATLDDPAQVPPADHVRARGQLPWVKLADGLPRYPGGRAEGME